MSGGMRVSFQSSVISYKFSGKQGRVLDEWLLATSEEKIHHRRNRVTQRKWRMRVGAHEERLTRESTEFVERKARRQRKACLRQAGRPYRALSRALEEFGLVPEGFELGARDLGKSSALFAGQMLHGAETARKFRIGFLEGDFGIDFEETGEIDGHEEEIAELVFDEGG
jgi:hypothetical protein